MKKTPLKRSGFRPQDPSIRVLKGLSWQRTSMRRTKLNVVGHSDTATIKRSIQALLREIVMIRDKGCILRNVRHCGGTLDTPGVTIQCDHLITRGNSATFGDSRLVVCVCQRCHAWKSLGSNRNKAQYDALVKTLLPSDRVKLWEACEVDSWRATRNYTSDWKAIEVALQQELRKCQC